MIRKIDEIQNIDPTINKDTKDAISQSERCPIMAATMSMIIPGLGQAYNCEIHKATRFFSIASTLVIMTLLLSGTLVLDPKMLKLFSVVIFISIFFWAYNVYDAYNKAKDKNKKENTDDGPLS